MKQHATNPAGAMAEQKQRGFLNGPISRQEAVELTNAIVARDSDMKFSILVCLMRFALNAAGIMKSEQFNEIYKIFEETFLEHVDEHYGERPDAEEAGRSDA